jgi:RHS repeat-associated protein
MLLKLKLPRSVASRQAAARTCMRAHTRMSHRGHSKTIVNDPDEGSKITYLHNALGQRVFKSEPQVDHVAPSATALGTPFITWLQSNFGWMFAQAQLDATLGQAYVYDDGQLGSTPTLLAEYGNGGSNATGRIEYLWLPTESGQPIPIGQHRGTIISATHSDHLGTPRKITGTDNNTAWQLPYSAFGENAPTGLLTPTSNAELALTNDAATATRLTTSSPLLVYNLRFPGQYFDSESRLSYNYFRSYQAERGGYTQSDPIGLAGGLNRFGYVGGNPLGFSDPMGLQMFAPTPWGPMLMPIPPTPGGQSHAPVPGWDPADGPAPAPGTGTIIWPPGFSPNPEPNQCRIDVPPLKPIVPPKPDCEQQLKSCMAIARAQKSILMSGACFIAYGICKKVFQ